MTDIVAIDIIIVFVKWTLPVVAVLSCVLFLKPKLFMDLEKKLGKEFIAKKSTKKTVALLERENMILHQALQKNNQIVGFLCLVLTIVIITKLY